MPLTEEQRNFIREHRLAVVGLTRRSGPPHLSPVYYVVDGDDILISTTASRFKAKAVRRNPEVSVCVLAESMPFAYVAVYGKGVVEEHGAPELMAHIGTAMSGNPIPEAAMGALEERAKEEGRVVLRVTPEHGISTLPLSRKQD
jgi:PPOX class probable F420-dependent enzyme